MTLSGQQTPVDVIHNETGRRFEASSEGALSLLTYRRDGDDLVLLHTEVPARLEGRGIGTRLAVAAFQFAESQHLKIVPRCPFIASFVEHHPEYGRLVSPHANA
jgi:predicted GNAT family acetyltransferase